MTTTPPPAARVSGTITREQALQIGLAALADIAVMRGAFGLDPSEDWAWAATTAGDAYRGLLGMSLAVGAGPSAPGFRCGERAALANEPR